MPSRVYSQARIRASSFDISLGAFMSHSVSTAATSTVGGESFAVSERECQMYAPVVWYRAMH